MPKSLPPAILATFFLHEGEKFRDYWDATGKADVFGVLVLTNLRLVFIVKEGFVSHRYMFGFDIPLEAIPGISIRTRRLRPPQLLVRQNEFVLGRPAFSIEKLGAIRAKIERARSSRVRTLSDSKAR